MEAAIVLSTFWIFTFIVVMSICTTEIIKAIKGSKK